MQKNLSFCCPVLGVVVALTAHAVAVAQEPPVLEGLVTLEEALESAFSHHPELRSAKSSVAAAGGQLRGARIYPFNPKLSVGGGARTESGETSADFRAGLSQEIERPKKRRERIAWAEAGLLAQRARYSRAARVLAARVHTAFVTALQARDLLAVAESDAELARRVQGLTERRLARGAATQLELNLAAAELGRARGRARAAQGTYSTARAELAEALGVNPLSPPTPSGTLTGAGLSPLPLEELAVTVQENRADVAALRLFEQQSTAAYELAKVSAWPNLTLRVFGGREGERETIVGGGVSVPLSIFNRNQGDIATTQAQRERATAERQRRELLALKELASTHADFRAALSAASELRSRVLGTLENNLTLLEKAFAAGKATWSEVLVIRRSLIDAQRELINAEAMARRAWVALELAGGRLPIPALSHEGAAQ